MFIYFKREKEEQKRDKDTNGIRHKSGERHMNTEERIRDRMK